MQIYATQFATTAVVAEVIGPFRQRACRTPADSTRLRRPAFPPAPPTHHHHTHQRIQSVRPFLFRLTFPHTDDSTFLCHMPLHTTLPAFLPAPTACAARPITGVPSNAQAASTQIRTAVHTALATGKRRLCVDLLLSALDPRARTYDVDAAGTVFTSLVTSMQSVLPRATGVRVVVAGPNAAVRASEWAAAAGLSNVTVDLLGVAPPSATGENADSALLLLNPPAGTGRVAETRGELKAAHAANVPIVVHNHPREDAVYESLGYRGFVSRELWTHDTAYLVAPFAIQAEGLRQMQQGTGSPEAAAGAEAAAAAEPLRFVLMRQFPGKWQLWKLSGEDGSQEVELESVCSDYILCREYDSRPENETLFQAIMETAEAA